MKSAPRARLPRLKAFDLAPGRVIGGKYVVERKVGSGWEGEVYKVHERRTGITRAAKLFFPQRNVADRAVLLYAKKLHTLRQCSLVTQYHHSETMKFRGMTVTCLISEYVEGELLLDFVNRQPSKRLEPFEALTLTHGIAAGLEEIHAARLYHGDLHIENIMVRRSGIGFRIKLIDFFHYGPTTASRTREDVADLVRILYDVVGGAPHYAGQPPEIKAVTKGLRRDLILKTFPTIRRLRQHLETFTWSDDPCAREGSAPV